MDGAKEFERGGIAIKKLYLGCFIILFICVLFLMTIGTLLFMPVEVPEIIEVKGTVQSVNTRINKYLYFKITVNGTTYFAEYGGARRALDKTAVNNIAIGDDAVLTYEKGTNNLRSLTVNDIELINFEEWMRQEQIYQRILGVVVLFLAFSFAILGVYAIRKQLHKGRKQKHTF